ncbi:hypothetical protein EWM62_06245 [Mucilaginibacter terrigena]|uniref:Uncharacterized protein n=1 Tax=Mucilaginibacter terrigena TaxID=2492395 RepID=A0A4Q5LQ28_9SPHI|nr:hypothetical protein [Mucilaginibacter terrigena]RYU91536.1 hypothetical protein EWM62_06245 [Mucilaginibacter terrigena]
MALKRATPFFFVAKKKRTKEKTRGCTASLLKGVLKQRQYYPQRAKAASGGLTFRSSGSCLNHNFLFNKSVGPNVKAGGPVQRTPSEDMAGMAV